MTLLRRWCDVVPTPRVIDEWSATRSVLPLGHSFDTNSFEWTRMDMLPLLDLKKRGLEVTRVNKKFRCSNGFNLMGHKFCDCLFVFLHTKSLLKWVYSKRKEFVPAGDKFCDFLFVFLHTKSILKGIYSKKIRICSPRIKFFPFRVDPFSEETWCAGRQIGSHKLYLQYK